MNFEDDFKNLTGNHPFPWQLALYRDWFCLGKFPTTCSMPTGLGKTSVVAVWLIALAHHRDKVPRRLVYVVNRRTVVDQTTIEVEKYRSRLQNIPALCALRDRLAELCALPLRDNNDNAVSPLAISTLRGQFADNREWSADPARPAVIVGTVDMIGSRVLFSGYGLGFKGKPLHAGFLGQDVLLVHDEAHLEPAFQKLLIGVEQEQRRSKEFRSFRVMELSATSRGTNDVFGLSDEDRANNEVTKRIEAKKAISLHELDDEKKLADRIAEIAQGGHTKGRALLVFVRKLDDVERIVKQLPKGATQQLTGTLRGLERDRMADPRRETGCPIFARFLKRPKPDADEAEQWNIKPQAGTVYLVCTSAGEVGVNISADHMVCDLSTFESMAQRFGRVNRFGDCGDTQIHIVHPTKFEVSEIETRRANTLELIENLNGDGSPKALGGIPLDDRLVAFAPEPTILPTSAILFDTWALTTIKGKLPGRAPVEPYLHGIEDNQASETLFAWREEVTLMTGKIGADDIEELLDQARLKPHELLRVTTYGKGRAYDQLQKIADRTPELPVWIVEPDGSLLTDKTISDLVVKRGADYTVSLASRTVILPPKAGGLTANGTLDGGEDYAADRRYDVAGLASESPLMRFKVRVDTDGDSWLEPVASITDILGGFRAELTAGSNRYRDLSAQLRQLKMLPVGPKFSLKLTTSGDDDDEANIGVQEYLILQSIQPKKGIAQTPAWPTLDNHLDGVRGCALAISKSLKFNEQLTRAIELSGAWHDLGKGRAVWQRGAGNEKAHTPVAKTIHGRPPENLNRYRHELGSLIDVCAAAEFAKEFEDLAEEQRDIVLHLIAAHHGRGRPHFPEIEASDEKSPNAVVESVVNGVPSRFARLQRKYGRWGLAYLESILRAADILDSQRIEATPLGDPVPGEWSKPLAKVSRFPAKPNPPPSIRINVDPANPGQFFACCGLLELADRLWPGAEGWFEVGEFCIACAGTLRELLAAARSVTIAGMDGEAASDDESEDDDGDDENSTVTPVEITSPVKLTLDWWGDKSIKTWAGSMNVHSIAFAMAKAIDPERTDPFSQCEVVYDPPKKDTTTAKRRGVRLKKREPFYFDSLRGPNAHARDVGFSPNDLKLTTTASPVVEFLCLLGLQRCRPELATQPRIFNYFTWNAPLSVSVVPAAVNGLLPFMVGNGFQFKNVFRSGQKKLKTYMPAIQLQLQGIKK